MTTKFKDHLKGSVEFQLYFKGNFWYKTTDTDLFFSVSIKDVGDISLLRNDKSALFERYIRKYLNDRHIANLEEVP